ncbi:MAG: hypothetical protein IIC71_09940 [Acidobacteria bacterium]|nr:hypothetical protein [Acidobacteriota bacterium]
MSLDSEGFDAGRAVRDASRDLEGSAVGEPRSPQKRIAQIAGIGVFVATLALVGIPLLWQVGRTAPPLAASTLPSTGGAVSTSTEVSAQKDAQQDLRLLDGGSLRVVVDHPVKLQSYSFFHDFPGLGGERLVTITATGGAAELAETESVTEDERLTDSATIWGRAGNPMFLSVDLGSWTAWLGIGSDTDRPTDNALLGVVDLLAGTSDDRGVTLPALRFEYYELNLVSTDGGTVTVRIGECFQESIPGASTIEHAVRGPLIRGDHYASWCDNDAVVEVTIDGSTQFVNIFVDTLSLTFS